MTLQVIKMISLILKDSPQELVQLNRPSNLGCDENASFL